MMTEQGYITGPQRVGGNILGNANTDAKILAAGRGRGLYTVGQQQVVTNRAKTFDAVSSGVRDPLERATMTAGERRINDAFVFAEASLRGVRPLSIGANSADRGILFDRVSADAADRSQMAFIRRVDSARKSGTASEKRLADLLWSKYNSRI